jgi:hypothetical protein
MAWPFSTPATTTLPSEAMAVCFAASSDVVPNWRC